MPRSRSAAVDRPEPPQLPSGGLSLGVRSFIDLKDYLKSVVNPPKAPTIDRLEYEANASLVLEAGEAKVHITPPQSEEFAILALLSPAASTPSVARPHLCTSRACWAAHIRSRPKR